jgi:hypothetical protein
MDEQVAQLRPYGPNFKIPCGNTAGTFVMRAIALENGVTIETSVPTVEAETPYLNVREARRSTLYTSGIYRCNSSMLTAEYYERKQDL